MRIDKYLKISRLIKRRTVAQNACKEGRVSINGERAKPGAAVKPGDIVCVSFGASNLKLRVLEIPEHVSREASAELYEALE